MPHQAAHASPSHLGVLAMMKFFQVQCLVCCLEPGAAQHLVDLGLRAHKVRSRTPACPGSPWAAAAHMHQAVLQLSYSEQASMQLCKHASKIHYLRLACILCALH